MVLESQPLPLPLVLPVLVVMHLLDPVDQRVVLLGVVCLEEGLLLTCPAVDPLLLLSQESLLL